MLRYEVTEAAGPGNDGERYSVTPDLGVYRTMISANGDMVVGEDRLRALLATATGPQLALGIDALLGSAWDDERGRRGAPVARSREASVRGHGTAQARADCEALARRGLRSL